MDILNRSHHKGGLLRVSFDPDAPSFRVAAFLDFPFYNRPAFVYPDFGDLPVPLLQDIQSDAATSQDWPGGHDRKESLGCGRHKPGR